MNGRTKYLLGLLVLLLPVAAAAQEKQVMLKPSSSLETVQNNCGGCHSLDYIGTNSSYMNHDAWQAEVNKMINAFGAPIDPKDIPAIVDYLVQNYGKSG